MRRLFVVVMLVVGAVTGGVLLDVVAARPASAHATLASTTPADGARLSAAPSQVRLEFTEAVELGAGYARVLAPGGERVDAGRAEVNGAVVTIPLRGDLPDASYLVTYRVLSEDSHPISGAYAFVVGDGELVAPSSVTGEQDVDLVVAGVLPTARWLGFAGVALGLGVPVFLLVCWPTGWAVPLMRRLTSTGLAAVVFGGLLTFLLQGPYAAGTGLGSLLDYSLLAATTSSAFGITLLMRALCALLLAAALAVIWRRGTPPSAALITVAALPAAGLVLTTAAVGHPVAGPLPALAVPITAVHVAGMAVWLGGLTALLTGVVRPGVPPVAMAAALPRYSRLAFGAVVALVVTGVLQSVREVGSPVALVTTTYGWLLVAKLALVLLLLAAAGISRAWVQQHLGVSRNRPGGSRVTAHAFAAEAGGAVAPHTVATRRPVEAATADLGTFRRSVLGEVAIGAVVLALSAVLVGTPPARSQVAEPVDVTLPLQGEDGSSAAGSVQITVDPAATGPNTLMVYVFDEAGQLTEPQGIRVTLTEAAQEIGPLEVDLVPSGPGHYVGDELSIPTSGEWTVTVSVRLDEFTAATASTDFAAR
ncbi:copper resistance protein CopC [Blastococcus sp. KM273128]|uniref:copper resistance CopC/CopD family protein n=1 Tax=Blastococcus sp. KM273128 TaxID=2570314 RepID=UPI001F1BB865|nr:FixH family protein [Blastococcus sp. KM273128]MCF6746134.1 copper resistance protein CopC [Blastococcus sp. KM273128]